MKWFLRELENHAHFLYYRLNPVLLIFFIFIIKLFSALFLIKAFGCLHKIYGIAAWIGDSPSYIEPMENFIKYGEYRYGKVTIGRIPYLGVLYFPFRIIFSKEISLSALILIQLFMESVAIFFMARLCFILTNKVTTFFFTIFFFLIYLPITSYSVTIMTESLAISFLCLFQFFYYKYLISEKDNKNLIRFSIFLALASIFRPFLIPIFGVVIGVELIDFIVVRRHSIKKLLAQILLIIAPLLIISLPWTIRNFLLVGKIIPFEEPFGGYATAKHPGYRPGDQAVFKFMRTIGENAIWWDSGAGCYFTHRDVSRCSFRLPERIFDSDLTPERVEYLRNLYLSYLLDTALYLEPLIIQEANQLCSIYIRNNPTSYYLFDVLRLLKLFLFRNPVVNLPFGKNSPCYAFSHKVIKGTQLLMYYFILLFGFTGLLVLFISDKNAFIFLLVPLIIIFVFMYFRYVETRYFILSHPNLILGTLYFFSKLNMTNIFGSLYFNDKSRK